MRALQPGELAIIVVGFSMADYPGSMPVSDAFEYGVFLSHSSQDKEIFREVANRLMSEGVRVWFDEREIGSIAPFPREGARVGTAKIEEGLEHSGVLLPCMSAFAVAADWPQLESHPFRFKELANHDRRFISLRLDDAPIKGSLAQFLYTDDATNKRASNGSSN
jgi:hypothetical protein